MLINENCFAHDTQVPAKAAFREAITQNCDWMGARRAIVILSKKPPGPWSDSEDLEVVTADQFAADAIIATVITDVHLRAAARQHSGEDIVLVAEILIHRIGKRIICIAAGRGIVRGYRG